MASSCGAYHSPAARPAPGTSRGRLDRAAGWVLGYRRVARAARRAARRRPGRESLTARCGSCGDRSRARKTFPRERTRPVAQEPARPRRHKFSFAIGAATRRPELRPDYLRRPSVLAARGTVTQTNAATAKITTMVTPRLQLPSWPSSPTNTMMRIPAPPSSLWPTVCWDHRCPRRADPERAAIGVVDGRTALRPKQRALTMRWRSGADEAYSSSRESQAAHVNRFPAGGVKSIGG